MTGTLLLADRVVTDGPGAAGALLVRDGRVAAVGDRDGLRREHGDATVVDLAGCTLVPGLVESHVHPVYTAMTASWADCRSPGCASIDDIVLTLSAHVRATTDGWVRGWGYDDTLLTENRHPTRDDLDRLGTDRPVVLSHISGHFAVANTRALELAGLHEASVARDDVRFPRGADDRLTGMLWEIDAVARVFDLIPTPTRDQLRRGLLDTFDLALTRGITAVHDLGVGLIAGPAELGLYRELDAADALPLRVTGFLRGDLVGSADVGPEPFEPARRAGARFRLAGAKFWADGSIQGLSAALRTPYACRADHCGELLQDAEELARMCAAADAAGAQLAVHANGDAAVEAATRALAPLQRTRAGRGGAHRIEHCQVSTVADLEAIAAAGLGVSFFANHLYYWGDRHRDRFLGPRRAAEMDALAWADRLGLCFGLHSDCPITPMDPVRTLWSASARRTSGGDVLGPDQRIAPLRALRAMTVDSHRLVGEQDGVGSLAEGQRADVVALDVDVVSCDADALEKAGVCATMVHGDWAFGP